MIIFGKFSRTLVVGKSASGKSVLVNKIIEKKSSLFEGKLTACCTLARAGGYY